MIRFYYTFFRCLHSTGGILQLLPERSCRVVVACAVLHNLAIELKLEAPDNIVEDEIEEDEVDDLVDERGGVNTRLNLIDRYFTN